MPRTILYDNLKSAVLEREGELVAGAVWTRTATGGDVSVDAPTLRSVR